MGGGGGGGGARGNKKSTCFIKLCALSLYRKAIDSVLSDGVDFSGAVLVGKPCRVDAQYKLIYETENATGIPNIS